MRCNKWSEVSPFLLSFLAVMVILPLSAEERPMPVSYDLKVTIDPELGTIAVRGTIDVPPGEPASKTVQFALHETFAIKQLSVNGHVASFSFQPAEPTPINPLPGMCA
jgi:hypothetical protein